MIPVIDATSIARFRAIVARMLGLHFDDTRSGQLAEVLQRRLESGDRSLSSYLERLESQDPPLDELRALIPQLTVPETYFFRNIDQFHACTDVALPARQAARAAARKLSLLSVGCASGEEAYSLAILLRENLPDAGWETSIRAVDINPAMIEKAKNAHYAAWALREMPADIQQRWLRAEGRNFVLDPVIRAAVQFEERNLAHENADLWSAGVYDIVFCRNLMMYFTPETARELVARITRALAPGGYLFLGHAETLRGLSQDYHLCHTHGTFYYQKKDTPGQASVVPVLPMARRETAAIGLPSPDVGWATTWIETIQRASDRIQVLAAGPQPVAERPRALAVAGRPGAEFGFALDLLQQERFSDALESLQSLPQEFSRDPDILLLRAVLSTHSGQLAIAEQVCRELLAIDELNSGAHYVLALCREGAGDRQGAIDHDQVAVYLDPSFAMPHLHLGLLARRTGDRETAQHELGEALRLLQGEDASRLLLFGGGFRREALVALCRTELLGAGGKP